MDSIELLLNSERSNDLTQETLRLLLTHDDISFIRMIIYPKAFNEIYLDNLKEALHVLISANKLDIVQLILNTYRSYELEEEVSNIFEVAAHTNNVALFQSILDCNNLEDLLEGIIKNCFEKAETQHNIEIIKLLFNSRKAADIPEIIFTLFKNIPETMSIETGRELIDLRRFYRIPPKILYDSFSNAVNKDSPLLRCLLNSSRVDEISVETLYKNAEHNNAVNHYLKFIMFHKNSFM